MNSALFPWDAGAHPAVGDSSSAAAPAPPNEPLVWGMNLHGFHELSGFHQPLE